MPRERHDAHENCHRYNLKHAPLIYTVDEGVRYSVCPCIPLLACNVNLQMHLQACRLHPIKCMYICLYARVRVRFYASRPIREDSYTCVYACMYVLAKEKGRVSSLLILDREIQTDRRTRRGT